jgi:predicted RNA binding protein YcfA (HicA-like mRNA interferase family)
MSSHQIIKRLISDGWELMAIVGSHHKFKHPVKPGRVVVPHPKRDIVIGTLRNIYRQAGWNWKE